MRWEVRMRRSILLAACLLLGPAVFGDATPRAWADASDDFTVQLIPEVDTIGDQIAVIHGFSLTTPIGPSYANVNWAFDSIFDTGASVTTFSASDRMLYDLFGSPVPIAKVGGAFAEGVGGNVIGDVSAPVYTVVNGISDYLSSDGMPLVVPSHHLNVTEARKPSVVSGVQMFVGTDSGSEQLPTIAGTPTLLPSANHPNGSAAYINNSLSIDLRQMFPDILSGNEPLLYRIPDVQFINAGSRLIKPTETNTTLTAPVRIPLVMLGENNRATNPGNQVTVAPNPFVPNVHLSLQSDTGVQTASCNASNFLFDTGAMMSLISRDTATRLGLDPDAGPLTLDVAGASGNAIQLHGYEISLLELSCFDLDGAAKDLKIANAPFFVYDVGEGIGGILGMNLFNTAEEMLYDPNDPNGASLQVIFDLAARDLSQEFYDPADYQNDPLAAMLISELNQHTRGSALPALPTGLHVVPEPGTFALLAIAALFGIVRYVGRRR
jgi:hypothetical protein